MAIPEDLSWLPKYPATIVTAVLLGASYQPFYAGAGYPESPALSWQGEYPDFVLRRRPTPIPPITFVRQPEPFLLQFSWHGWHPDRLDRRVVHASRQQALAFDGRMSLPAAVVPDLAWVPTYPAWIARRTLHPRLIANQARVSFTRATELTTFPLYPDLITRRQIHASQQRAWFFEGRPIIPPPEVSWQATYPDWIAQKTSVRAAQQIAWTFHPDPVPDPVPEATSWYGGYPDFARPQVSLRASLQQTFTINTAPIPNPPAPAGVEAWAAKYPDPLPRPTRVPEGLQRLSAPILPAIPFDLRWTPTYPDQIVVRPRLRGGIEGILRIDDTSPVLLSPASLAAYPDQIRRRVHVRGDLSVVWLIAPPPIPPPECIEWVDVDLTVAILTAQDLSVPIFLPEDVTSGDFDEEAC